MEFINEGFTLGIDLIILGVCVKEYRSYKKVVHSLKSAPQLTIHSRLGDYVEKQENSKIPYAIVRGTVTPIGKPIKSLMSPSVTGVIQIIKLSEHRVARGFAGFWSEQRKLVHSSSKEIPFMIKNGKYSVEVIDSLSSAIMDLDTVYDSYEPSSLSLFDHLFGFFSGVRQKGLQTTEEMLRDGSFITAIGELEFDNNQLKLQPSNLGPMFLTTATKGVLIKKFEEAKSSMLVKIFMCSCIAGILIGIIGRKFYLKKKEEKNQRRERETLDKNRRERRARIRPDNLTEEQLCVVCVTNPKEIIVLPCGHVCICEDCSERIKYNCPVCRGIIETRAPAFIT